jgi:hypothetical protein
MYDFTLVCADTDSITICKKDGSAFPEVEIASLTAELNSLFDNGIRWEFEFNLPKMAVLKAKNYIMKDKTGKISIKGSGLKAPNKEIALKEFLKKTIDSMMNDRDDFRELYESYVREIINMSDISRWCSKRSISTAVLNPKRPQEQKVFDIIQGKEFVEGDRIRVYFRHDGSLGLQQDFADDHCRKTLLKKLHNTSEIFASVLMTEDLYVNYTLKRNQKLLESLQ